MPARDPGSQHGGLVAHEVSTDRGAFHDALPDDTTRRAVAVPGRAGDAVFFSPLLHHASGANTSDRPRHSFTTVYTNPLVDVHREVYGCFFPIDGIKAMGGPGPFGFCGEHYQRRNLRQLAADHVADLSILFPAFVMCTDQMARSPKGSPFGFRKQGGREG